MDSAIHLINLYLEGSAIGYNSTYLPDNDLSHGYSPIYFIGLYPEVDALN